jgi:hypothetical protein
MWRGQVLPDSIVGSGCLILFYAFLRVARTQALIATGYRWFDPAYGCPARDGACSVGRPSAPAILLTIFVVVAFVAPRSRRIWYGSLPWEATTVTFVAVTPIPALATMLIVSIQSFRHDRLILE